MEDFGVSPKRSSKEIRECLDRGQNYSFLCEIVASITRSCFFLLLKTVLFTWKITEVTQNKTTTLEFFWLIFLFHFKHGKFAIFRYI